MRNLLPILLPFSLASVVGAQEPLTGPRQLPVEGPLERVVLDIGTGRVTRLDRRSGSGGHGADAVALEARATANCFLNVRTMGFFSRGPTDTEWRDWAAKGTGKTGIVDRFYFAYATLARDPDHPNPGPGGALDVSFYRGETGFCSGTGVEVARYCFTGLPGIGGTLGRSMGGGFLITAIVPSNAPLCLPDGPIGWGFGFKDDDGSGEGMTGPITTSFVSENTGAADAFDLYNRRPSSTGTCLGSFHFQGCEPLPQPPAPAGHPCANFYIGLREYDGAEAASTSSWNPTLCNPETFATVTGPVIGQDWEVLHSPVTETRSLLAVSLAAAGPSGNLCRNGAKLAKLNGTALYAFGPYLLPHSVVGSVPSPAPDPTTHVLPVNKELDLVGLRFCTQGFGIDFGPVSIHAKNALVIEVGTSQ